MKSKIKILELTTSFPRFVGDSVGSFIFNKVEVLNNIGIKNDILAPHDKSTSKKEFFDKIKIYRFTYFFNKKFHILAYNYGISENLKKYFLAKLQLPFLIFAFFIFTLKYGRKYDIIHANWSIAGLGGLFAAKILRKKFVLTMHGAEVFELKKNYILSLLIFYTQNLIVNSNYTLTQLKKYYSLKNKHITILPFGVKKLPEIKSYEDHLFWNKKFNIPKNHIVIFSLGRLVERKGHKYLIKAFKKISKKYFNIHLVIAGIGPEKNNLKQQVRNLNLDNIYFVDFIKEDELPYFYTNSFCFILPAIIDKNGDTEGLGVVNIEALSYGIPVISTNVGGITDVIINKKTGILVAPKNSEQIAEAVFTLLKDNNLYCSLKNNGITHVEQNFLWNSIAEKYSVLYNSL